FLHDIDGNRFIDFHSSAGAAFFGHNNPRIRAAVERSLELGFFVNFDSEYHYELAELLCQSVPSAEKVRLSNTGTEATLGAIRLARGYTGRDKVVRMEGHFHGMHEAAFYNHGKLGEIDAHGEVVAIPDSDGFPDADRAQIIVCEHNNQRAFDHILDKYRGQIAAVILEPVSFNCGCMPCRKEFLQHVRERCTSENVVLIFDEVLTGFRMALGGAQEYYQVTPDLTTLAKAVAGGFPLAALVGKAAIMDALTPNGRVVMSGTYTGALMPVLVAIECLRMLREPGFYQSLIDRANQFYDAFNNTFKEFGIPGHIRGVGARFATYFGIEDPELDYDFRSIARSFNEKLYQRFVKGAIEQGLYFHAGGWASGGVALPVHAGITTSHGSAVLDEAIEVIRRVFEKLASNKLVGAL
ncbi:MAG: aminotransferase class III-fold pyridoxal phosphate-dependent enzyme, partial [Verrucomicrobia bacterium]|nr:aminotransferase class III-fold pyridoxal phosphate-dependent enzyme [Verrucomicrobiota bacterium]